MFAVKTPGTLTQSIADTIVEGPDGHAHSKAVSSSSGCLAEVSLYLMAQLSLVGNPE